MRTIAAKTKKECKALLKEGFATQGEIANLLGISPATVSRIAKEHKAEVQAKMRKGIEASLEKSAKKSGPKRKPAQKVADGITEDTAKQLVDLLENVREELGETNGHLRELRNVLSGRTSQTWLQSMFRMR